MAASAGDIGPTAGMAAARQYENYYEYDPAGNRTLLWHGETAAEDLTYYAYNGANELTSLHDAAGWTYFGYDQNGNTVMEQAPGYTRYFDWDGRDMLVGVRSTEAGWTDNVYRYDGLASRVSTLESSGLTYYDWDSINVIQEKEADGDVTDRQVHGYAPIFSVGDIALMDKSGTAYVPVPDQVGTTWNLVNSEAAKANSYAYDAFGVGRSTSETVSNLYRFGTKRLDADSALYHFIARQYGARFGRFGSRDPLVIVRAMRYIQDPCRAGRCPLLALGPNGRRLPSPDATREVGRHASGLPERPSSYRYSYYNAPGGLLFGRDPWRLAAQGTPMYVYAFSCPAAYTDPTGLWFLDLIELIPGAGTIVNLARTFWVGRPGMQVGDYVSCAVKPKPCCNPPQPGVITPETECSQCVDSLTRKNVGLLWALHFPRDVIEVFATLVAPACLPAALALAVDSILDAGITVHATRRIAEAAEAAKTRYCDCSPFRGARR